jgi:hypothetical protein
MQDPARDLADPSVQAASLTKMLPYWGVVRGAMLLRDGSYEVGFEIEPIYLDSMSDVELEVLHRRLMRLVETLPSGERLRFVGLTPL